MNLTICEFCGAEGSWGHRICILGTWMTVCRSPECKAQARLLRRVAEERVAREYAIARMKTLNQPCLPRTRRPKLLPEISLTSKREYMGLLSRIEEMHDSRHLLDSPDKPFASEVQEHTF